MSGWWGDYSLKCQPVDYSDNPKALRVSTNQIKLEQPNNVRDGHLLCSRRASESESKFFIYTFLFVDGSYLLVVLHS